MTYFRLIGRNVRFQVFLWLLILCGISLSIPSVFNTLYGTEEERLGMKMTVDNPAMVALIGPIPEGDYTSPVMFAHQMLLIMAIFHGLFNILIANGIGRKAEEEGLTEYILTTGTKKSSIISSQIILGIIINLLVCAILVIGLQLITVDGLSLPGNLYYALGLSLFGLLFFVLTLFYGQLFQSADFTFGLTLTVLLALYLYRAMTDVVDTRLSVISPYHWLSRVEAYGAESSGLWLIPFSIIILLVVLSYVLFYKRDLGSGYFNIDKKPKERKISGYFRLAFVNSKVLMMSWMVGLFIVGLSYGSIFGDLDQVIGQNDMLKAAFEGQDGTMFFINLLFIISALIATVPALMVNGRFLTEEKSGRLEMMNAATLNNRVSRITAYLIHWFYANLVGILSYLLTLVGMYLASINVTGLALTEIDYIKGLINYSAAIVFITGVSSLLIGIYARLHIFVWIYLAYIFLVNYLGSLMDLNENFLKLSPFYYLSDVPIEGLDELTVVIVASLGIVMMLIGIICVRRRNLL